MNKRDLLSLEHYTPEEIRRILKLAADLKKQKGQRLDVLRAKSIGLLFQKPSNRTRVSFEVGIWQLGGNCIYLGPEEIDLGKRESAQDVAKTLSRYLDAIVARTHSHADIIALGKNASIPIINGLSDLFHPCQALADIFSIQERFGTFEGITVTYIGDGNNVCHSLILAGLKMGLTINIASPRGYEPKPEVVAKAEKIAKDNNGHFTVSHSAQNVIKNAQVVYTDVWTSMGQEKETQQRLQDFHDYQLNRQLVGLADPEFVFMHCLPAHRGQEVTEEVIDGPHSIVFDQAENRMHVQKAVLVFLLKNK